MIKKRIWKSFVIVVICLLVVLITMAAVDYYRATCLLKKPSFAVLDTDTAKKDFGSGTYLGIGYSIYIEGNFMPEDELPGVTRTRFYLFGKELKNATRD